ncbi:MAG: ATP-binding protein [Actinoplanes sp.]
MEVLRVQFRHGEPAAPLRHALRTTLENGLPASAADTVEDTLLIVSELVQNVSQHTRCDGELVVSFGAGEVLVEVGDSDPALPRLRHPDGHRIGGRGLLLVAGVAVSWGVRRAAPGKVVWARVPAEFGDEALDAA